MSTYEIANEQFSNLAHEAAHQQIYPALFGVDPLSLVYESTQYHSHDGTTIEANRFLDIHLAIDRIIECRGTIPTKTTVQERFKRMSSSYERFGDSISLTLKTRGYNEKNLPGEIQHLAAQIVVHGWFHEDTSEFESWVVINVFNFMQAFRQGMLSSNRIEWEKKNQTFLSFNLDSMERDNPGIIVAKYDRAKGLRHLQMWE